jgi:hypothetical protein
LLPTCGLRCRDFSAKPSDGRRAPATRAMCPWQLQRISSNVVMGMRISHAPACANEYFRPAQISPTKLGSHEGPCDCRGRHARWKIRPLSEPSGTGTGPTESS